MGDRCNGRCCSSPKLGWAPGTVFDPALDERARIAAMMTYLPAESRPELGEWRYRCNNLLPSGDCGIYEIRPNMCRNFPYEHPCPYGAECTSDDARAGRMGRKRHLPLAPESAAVRL